MEMRWAALALALVGCRGDERAAAWREVIDAPVTVDALPRRLGYCRAAQSAAGGEAERLARRCRASVPAMVNAARAELEGDEAARLDGCRHACAALALAGEGTPPVDEARRAVAAACAGPLAPTECAAVLAVGR